MCLFRRLLVRRFVNGGIPKEGLSSNPGQSPTKPIIPGRLHLSAAIVEAEKKFRRVKGWRDIEKLIRSIGEQHDS